MIPLETRAGDPDSIETNKKREYWVLFASANKCSQLEELSFPHFIPKKNSLSHISYQKKLSLPHTIEIYFHLLHF